MKKLWLIFGFITLLSFGTLLWIGTEIFREAPPIPTQVVTTDGTVLIDEDEISKGQNVWQALGGMQIGSIWGHGSYVAPDWTADYLHREAEFVLDDLSNKEYSQNFAALDLEKQALIKQRMKTLMRTNNYDAATGKLTIEPVRAEAFKQNLQHYSEIFTNGNKEYAIQKNAQSDPEKLRLMTSFFFWTSWASAANRPGNTISYTSNFPSEPLIDNVPTSSSIIWTGVSVIALIAGIGVMVWFFVGTHEREDYTEVPDRDPLIGSELTPSQTATVKYFLVVTLLFLLQILLGVVTAHYGVEGHGFYGIPLSDYLPYVVTRTWHVQLGIFWIATAWLAAGLFIGPIICEYEPKYQKLGVDVLFGALLIVVLGSMCGQWMSVMHKLGSGDLWFWFGHQGYEYVDLGRVWQAALFVGLLLWFGLILRTALPALMKKDSRKSLLLVYLVATAGIALFYAPGLFWGMKSHITVVEYWRWWVVHLWVEGYFEVFATAVIAFLFVKLGVVNAELAAKAALLTGAIYLTGGILGMFHHLYFAGTPTVAIAVAFWNLVGAGIFGFMVNPPIALYYMQGLNTTAVHAHGALYGVYGTLGLGLLLFVMRAIQPERKWNDKLIGFAFWGINGGLLMMILFSLLPIGLLQTYQSVNAGYWSARSTEFMQTDLMQFLRWMRVVGDTVFAVGAVAFVWFALDLIFRKGDSVKA